jgi:uncharacterized protein
VAPLLWTLLGALTIGLSLGLLGSGGSILTVPILVYGLGWGEKAAITGSLAIVGGIALAGALAAGRRGHVEGRTAALLALPGMVGTTVGTALGTQVSGAVQLVMFALVMLGAAISMLRPPAAESSADDPRSPWLLALDGLLVGALTGFVGVGGGFLIVPVLVLLARLPPERAVGTSLAVIAANAGVGFWRSHTALVATGAHLDFRVIALFVAVGIAGTWLGRRVGRRWSPARFRRTFAVVLVGMALAILLERG